jgi:hypothetical protein
MPCGREPACPDDGSKRQDDDHRVVGVAHDRHDVRDEIEREREVAQEQQADQVREQPQHVPDRRACWPKQPKPNDQDDPQHQQPTEHTGEPGPPLALAHRAHEVGRTRGHG